MPDLKPELSEKNKYWIPKHRYYELKHYCLQYPHWEKLYRKLADRMKAYDVSKETGKAIYKESEVEKWAIILADLDRAMQLVRKCACDTNFELKNYIFKAVTQGIPFVQLQTMSNIPCGKDMYYDCYRKFFYLLSQRRGI